MLEKEPLSDAEKKKKFRDAFFLIVNFIKQRGWAGACHPSVAVLYAICKLLSINATPCIGESSIDGFAFDHSWINIDGKIYDAAIVLPLQEEFASGPVFNDLDLSIMDKTHIKYGVFFSGLDDEANKIKQKNLLEYFSEAPGNLLFKLVDFICKKLNIDYSISELRNMLHSSNWAYVCESD